MHRSSSEQSLHSRHFLHFRAGLAGLCLGALALSACDPPPPKAPNVTRMLDERRAIEIIHRAVSAEGQRPTAGRDEPISNGTKTLHVDVSIDGKKFGIAYITADDQAALGSEIQAPNKPEEKLRLQRVGADGSAFIVLLYQVNYRYDDLSGEGHEQTTISCETELTRDVRDFVTYALSKQMP